MSKEADQSINIIITDTLKEFGKANLVFDSNIKAANERLAALKERAKKDVKRDSYSKDDKGRRAYNAAVEEKYAQPDVQKGNQELKNLRTELETKLDQTIKSLLDKKITEPEIATVIMKDKELYKLYVDDRGISEMLLERQNNIMSNIIAQSLDKALDIPTKNSQIVKLTDKQGKAILNSDGEQETQVVVTDGVKPTKAELAFQQINKISELEKNYNELSPGESEENQWKLRAPIQAQINATKKLCSKFNDQDAEQLTIALSASLKMAKPELTNVVIKAINDVTKENPKLLTIGTALKAECYLTNEIKAAKDSKKTIGPATIERLSKGLDELVGAVLKDPEQQKAFAKISKDLVRERAAQEKQLSFGQKIKHAIDKIFHKKTAEQKMAKILADHPELQAAIKGSLKLTNARQATSSLPSQKRGKGDINR